MFGYIYKTTNTINGKIYIGKKKSETFLGEKYLGSGIRLNSAISKYGKESFVVELLDSAQDLTELNAKEVKYIAEYNSRDPGVGYNIAAGGDGGAVWGDPQNHPSIGKHRSGEDSPTFNRKWYTNGDVVLYLKPCEVVPEGFYPGTNRKPNKGRITIYSIEGVRKSIHPEELEHYKSMGWITADDRRKKLKEESKRIRELDRLESIKIKQQQKELEKLNRPPRVSWAKGLTKETNETIKRLAEAKIGHHYNCGWHHTAEARKKIAESRIDYKHSEDTISRIKEGIQNMSEEAKTLRRQRLSLAQSNLCWVTNGDKPIRINVSELQKYLDSGYIRGRKFNK